MSDFWIRKMRTFFRRLDVINDGVLTVKDAVEFGRIFSERRKLDEENGNILRSRLLEVWSLFTKGNVDVIVPEDDFVEAMKNHMFNPAALAETMTESLKIIFKVVDADGDGSIEMDELVQAFESLGLDKRAAPVSFKATDSDGDGQITLDEFIATGFAFFRSEDEEHPSKYFIGPLI